MGSLFCSQWPERCSHGKGTSMRRHCLSSRRGGPMCVVDATALCPSRYASIRTVSESTLLCGSVHRMRSVFSSQKRCYLLSGLSSLRMDQVRLAQSPLEITSAFGRVQPWLCATLGSPGRCSDLHLLFARLNPSPLFKLPPYALGADACCRAGRIPLP